MAFNVLARQLLFGRYLMLGARAPRWMANG
jgi:hypothetical protein